MWRFITWRQFVSVVLRRSNGGGHMEMHGHWWCWPDQSGIARQCVKPITLHLLTLNVHNLAHKSSRRPFLSSSRVASCVSNEAVFFFLETACISLALLSCHAAFQSPHPPLCVFWFNRDSCCGSLISVVEEIMEFKVVGSWHWTSRWKGHRFNWK